ncbi:MAG: type VI secretion system protein TssA [Acidobacteriota bacterium]
MTHPIDDNLRPDDGFGPDFEELLRPISEQQPAGDDLRWQGLHDEIRELRREEDPSLPRGVWQRDLKRADWDRLELLAREALETRSKDLHVAGWLAEAWTARLGFAGCARGLRLVAALCERFWDSVHPQDDDLDVRVAPLLHLDSILPLRLQRQPITAPTSTESTAYSWRDWRSAGDLKRIGRVDPKAAESEAARRGGVTEEKIAVAVSLTDTDFYQRLAQELHDASEALDALHAALDAQLGTTDAPHLRQVDELLDVIGQFIDDQLAHRLDDDEAAADGDAIDDDSPGGARRGPSPSAPIRSRADAYRRLSEAAAYLQRTEPHSPTPYLVQRAVAWGDMTLTQLLRELVTEDGHRQAIYRLLGVDNLEDS